MSLGAALIRTTVRAARVVFLLTASVVLSSTLHASPEGQQVNRARSGLAIHGYDPVAYFVEFAADALRELRCELTLVAGRVVYEAVEPR